MNRPIMVRIALAAAFAALAIGPAPARAGACPASITACGCTITAAGIYAVAQDLTGTSGADCIRIKTVTAVLNLQGHTIVGPGAVGIHVLKGASSLMLEGKGATISGFTIGIEDEGSKVVGENFNLSNNLAEGLVLSKVRQSLFSHITANADGASGVRITGGGTNGVSTLTASGNLNGGNGVLIQGSSTNLISQYTASNNSGDGVLITCIPRPSRSAAVFGCGPGSSGNLVYDGVASGNAGNGIEITADSKKGNLVGDNTAQNNGSGTDLVDGTKGCGGLLGNVWFTNTFGRASQNSNSTCVQ